MFVVKLNYLVCKQFIQRIIIMCTNNTESTESESYLINFNHLFCCELYAR